MLRNLCCGLVAILTVAALPAACDATKPTPIGNEGEWSGTTIQGTPISFTVSPDQKVTRITLGYNFNGCSGSQTFSDLSLETAPNVSCIPGPCSDALLSYRAFAFAEGERSLDAPRTVVNGLFLPSGTAQGTAGFFNYPVCGTIFGVEWSARRR